MNNCTLAGRIVRYISLKTTTTGKSLVENCIAIRRNKDETDFIEFVAWGTIADNLVKYSKMGDMIIVSGEIRADKFQTKNGEKRTKVYLLVNNMEFTGKRERTEEAPSSQGDAVTQELSEVMYPEYDELPF